MGAIKCLLALVRWLRVGKASICFDVRMNQIDGTNQFASGYVGMSNNPVNGIDLDSRDTWLVAMAVGTSICDGKYANISHY